MSEPEHLRYARDVVDGRIVASLAVIAQCSRSLAEHAAGYVEEESFGEARRYVWRPEPGDKRIKFMRRCPHPSGRWRARGELLNPAPWQRFFVQEVYGWVDEQDPELRRYREAILFIARKNGKTTICAALGLHEAGWGDAGSEAYVIATKAEQSEILWNTAGAMIDGMKVHEPRLASMFRVTSREISGRQGKFKALASKSTTLDGLNPSFAVADEAAAITDTNQIHVIESGMGSRDSPLMLLVSTAQPVRATIFRSRYEIAKRGLLNGSIPVSSFAMLYELDDIAEVDKPECWLKANPNLGVSVQRRQIGIALAKSAENPRERGLTLCKQFNVWSQYESAWIPVDTWNACAGRVVEEGPCYVGLDLAENRDLAAGCAVWDNGAGRYSAQWRFWTPRASLALYPPDDRAILEAAAAAGLLVLLDGPIVDTDLVREWVEWHAEARDLRRVGTDPWHAKRLTAELEDRGLPILQISQSMAVLSDPIKTTENLVVSGALTHDGSPFLAWQIMNVVAINRAHGAVQLGKPDGEPHRKIDGIDALVNAIACVDYTKGAFAVSDMDLEEDEESEEFEDDELIFA